MRGLIAFLLALIANCDPDVPADSGTADTAVVCDCPPAGTLDCQPELPSADHERWCGPCIQFVLNDCPDVGVVF